MIFRELKTGYPIFMLDKGGDSVKYTQARVKAVTAPHYEKIPNGQTSQLVVDITIDANGVEKQYCMQEGAVVAYCGDVVISTDKEHLLTEVQSLKHQSEDIVNSVDRHKRIITDCDSIIGELDVVYKERRENDERLSKMESSISDLKDIVEQLIDKLK